MRTIFATFIALSISAAADDSVSRFLADNCLRCHGEEKQKGDVAFHDLQIIEAQNAELWGKIVEALKFGEMPPDDEPQPSEAAVDSFLEEVEQKLLAAGFESDADHKMKQPAYGNLLNHEKLFDGSIEDLAFSPPRLWRLHPEAYAIMLEGFGRELPKGGPLSKPFTVGEGKGLPSNYAAILQADSATLGQLMLNCRQVAQLQTSGFKKMEKNNRTKEMEERHYVRRPESFEAILESGAPPSNEQVDAAVKEEFQLVLGREPDDAELKRFSALLSDAIEIGGNERGLHTMAMAVMLRPDAIYRMEIGLSETDDHGRRMLSPYELANAIAFALTDSPPDKILLGEIKNKRPQPPSLLDVAEAGELKTRKDVERIVRQMWEREDLEKPRILRFFREYFGYHTADKIFKGDRAPREFNTRHLMKDADDLVMHIVNEDKDVLRQLLTTERYFFQWPGSLSEYERRIKYITDRAKKPGDRNYKYFIDRTATGLKPIPQANPGWRSLIRYYNLHEDTWDYPLDQPFQMPEGQRVGLLTHPAWLVAWSGNSGNDPIRRGKWIYENLLAGHIPEVPITVDAQVPEDPDKTLRQRLEATRDEYCWKCHQKMNPLGLPFEAYDDFGKFRTEEGLGHTKALAKPKNSASVETKGAVIASGVKDLDGDVADARELMHRLADSDRVRQSFVRHAFRYWLGRNEMMSDSPVLIAADEAYEFNKGSFKELVVSLLTSDSFLYRK